MTTLPSHLERKSRKFRTCDLCCDIDFKDPPNNMTFAEKRVWIEARNNPHIHPGEVYVYQTGIDENSEFSTVHMKKDLYKLLVNHNYFDQ